jgi:hypothetical protein
MASNCPPRRSDQLEAPFRRCRGQMAELARIREAYVKLASEYSDLQPFVGKIRAFDAAFAERSTI